MGMLPYSDYEWMPKYQTTEFDIENTDLNGEKGYILEVDLEYPDNLHYMHNDFPLAPETNVITLDDLSSYSKKCFLNTNNSKNYKSTKLTATCFNRYNYVVHIKNLKLYIELGLKLKKIHKILKFTQKDFLRPFIEKCTEERKNSSTIFEKTQYKTLSNSCYGKTIENVRDYISVKLHNNNKSFMKSMSKHTFKNFTIIDEDLVTTSHRLPEIIHDKPYAVGFTILEYSKHFMYEFYYKSLLSKCGFENVEILFSDTDSLCFYTKDNKKFNEEIHEFMDYSNYPNDHYLYDECNKAQLGYFKDEIKADSVCTEFVGLRSKCYALKIKDVNEKVSEKKVCKGLGKLAIKNRLKFREYKKCLFKKVDIRHNYTGIVSQKHNLFTVIRNKKALSCFDSKRWLFNCGIHSSPFGSILVKKYGNKCYKCLKSKSR